MSYTYLVNVIMSVKVCLLSDGIGSNSSTPVTPRKRGDKKDLLSRSHKKAWYKPLFFRDSRSYGFLSVVLFLLWLHAPFVFFFLSSACFVGCSQTFWLATCLSVGCFSCTASLMINIMVFSFHLSVACRLGDLKIGSVLLRYRMLYTFELFVLFHVNSDIHNDNDTHISTLLNPSIVKCNAQSSGVHCDCRKWTQHKINQQGGGSWWWV